MVLGANLANSDCIVQQLLVSVFGRRKGSCSVAICSLSLSPRICNCVPCVRLGRRKWSLLNGTGRRPLHKAIYIVPRLGSPGIQVRGDGAKDAVARVRRDETWCQQNVVRDGWVGFHALAVWRRAYGQRNGTVLACE
jgi:hypothetical protein